MTREYARVRISIWADQDFRDLSGGAQSLYFRLMSSPTMNLAGVADWRPKRIAALTRGMTAKQVLADAQELVDTRYIVIDDDTEEVLLRSFVRHDGLIKTPNIAAAMAKDYAGVSSRKLRGVIVHELHRLYDEDPGMKGWATASHLLNQPSIDPSDKPSGNPSAKASPIPSTKASGSGSHIPQPASLNQQPSSPTDSATRADAESERPDTAQTLIGEWITACKKRPPQSVVGQIAKQVGAMLSEGIDADEVRAGLTAWQRKGVHPSVLPSIVHEIRSQPAVPRPPRADEQCSKPGHSGWASNCAQCRSELIARPAIPVLTKSIDAA